MAMRILVVGGGGREHALLWKLAKSSIVSSLLCAPGNAGTSELAENLPIRANDVEGIVRAATERAVDVVVVGPEEPLSLGLADRLREAGILVFGNSQAATRIESSKAFAKEVMAAAGISTARATVVRDLVGGIAALSSFEVPIVIKADGLAAGKGVVVAQSRDEARMALTAFLEDQALGAAGATVVIEECLSGQEVSVLALTDGTTVIPFSPSCDHKRIFDGDKGPNTGGMGAYSPTRALGAGALAEVQRTVLEPAVKEMAARGAPLQGALYAGLMMTPDGPKVLEFNARLGDPETQVVLPLLDGDLAELCLAVANGTLGNVPPVSVANESAVAVVIASGGYPGPIQSGEPIGGLDDVPEDVLVFHAGTRRTDDGRVVTAGGRVLNVVGFGADLASARERAYAGVERISFAGAQFRRDIGSREL
jgi:phosphoribosylamine---glycine ligase